MNNAASLDFDSTLIRRGVHAATFSEMAEFAETIESRPLDKLLNELASLSLLSDLKFTLARQVIRRRARLLDPADREQLEAMALEIADAAPTDIAHRIRAIFE